MGGESTCIYTVDDGLSLESTSMEEDDIMGRDGSFVLIRFAVYHNSYYFLLNSKVFYVLKFRRRLR